MRSLIYDMLDVTRIESGEKARSLEPLDVRELAEMAVETALPEANKLDVEIGLEMPGGLGFSADRGELEIILNNLISNAVKYNKPGGSVHAAINLDGDTLRIRVEDTGIGMAPAEQEKLFTEFYRAKNENTRNIMGTGLGLSTVKRLASLYGGGVTVESAPGKGSVFSVSLQQQN